MCKVTVLEYRKNRSIAVKTESSIEKESRKLYGMFVVNSKVGSPCYVFSNKRKSEVEKLAKQHGAQVKEYTPGRSVALVMEPEKHVKALIEAGAHFNPGLKDGETRFEGWIFPAKKVDEVNELVKSF